MLGDSLFFQRKIQHVKARYMDWWLVVSRNQRIDSDPQIWFSQNQRVGWGT
jgi:hypothetical protein